MAAHSLFTDMVGNILDLQSLWRAPSWDLRCAGTAFYVHVAFVHFSLVPLRPAMTEGEYIHSLYAISLYALWRHLPPGIQRLPPGSQRSNPILSLSRFQVGEHQVASLNPNQNQLNEWTQDLQAVSQKKVPCSKPGLEKKNTAGIKEASSVAVWSAAAKASGSSSTDPA
ncbi:uncharacterized protein LOC103006346 isoform X2 [Balaenoptera acutorostrata]|nr:uncharacterized protein LOC103006346 isoform X2 [Balaenoptera acutorostrata]